MNIETSAVLINGCHLKARIGEADWYKIAFGGKNIVSLYGRVPMGLKVAINTMTDKLILGTGTSHLNGLSEAEVTLNEVIQRRSELIDLLQLEFSEIKIFDTILDNATLDTVSVNTEEEVKMALDLCLSHGLDDLMIVSSAWHTMRALSYGINLAEELTQSGYRRIEVSATAAYGSTMDTAISEPPHRGDRPKLPIHQLVRRADRLGRHPEKADQFFPAFEDLVKAWE